MRIIITEVSRPRGRSLTSRGWSSRGRSLWPHHTGVITVTQDTGKRHGKSRPCLLVSRRKGLNVNYWPIRRPEMEDVSLVPCGFRSGSKYGNYELTPIFIFDKDTVDQCCQKFRFKEYNICSTMLGVACSDFKCFVKLNNVNFRHQRAHKQFPTTACHLEDTHR